jgi:hypothetical protein
LPDGTAEVIDERRTLIEGLPGEATLVDEDEDKAA